MKDSNESSFGSESETCTSSEKHLIIQIGIAVPMRLLKRSALTVSRLFDQRFTLLKTSGRGVLCHRPLLKILRRTNHADSVVAAGR